MNFCTINLTILFAATLLFVTSSARAYSVPSQQVLIDSDMGYDDFAAINMLLANNQYKTLKAAGLVRDNPVLDNTKQRQVLALETVLGDLYSPNGTDTGLRLFQLVNSSSPEAFHQSSSLENHVPFVRNGANTYFPSGLVFPFVTDKLEGVNDELPRTTSISPLGTLTFMDHVLEFVNSKKFTVLAIGPLTNIALFVEDRYRDPHLYDAFVDSIDQIVIMGGAVNVSGNVPPLNLAEYNIRGDPHAAHTVFKSMHSKIVLIPLDCMLQAVCEPLFVDAIKSSKGKSVPSDFLKQSIEYMCKEWEPNVLYDLVAASYLLDPSILTTHVVDLSVITEGPEIGRTLLNGPDSVPIRVATSIDLPRLYELLVALVNNM